MTFFGMTDPYIIGGYLSCIVITIMCCVWAIWKKDEEDKEEGED
jgi:hypothetical protein